MEDPRYENETNPRIRGRCPSCRAESLFLGCQGYVTCSVIGCKDPGAAHDLLASQEAAPSAHWQDIATAPKDGTEILLTDGYWKRTGWWAKRTEHWAVDTAVSLKPPTHWAPLPSPPAQEGSSR